MWPLLLLQLLQLRRVGTRVCLWRKTLKALPPPKTTGPAGPKPWELLPRIEAPIFIAWG